MSKSIQGRYRPALRAAWLRVARDGGLDPKDKSAADAWSRGELAAVCGLTTTAGASDETMELLCKHFEAMVEVEPAFVSGFTEAQNRACKKLALTAWKVTKARYSTTPVFETWFNARFGEAIAQGGNRFDPLGGNRFDTLMGYLAAIAGDEYWLDRTARAAETRMRHQVGRKLVELETLLGRSLGWKYVVGMFDQANSRNALGPSLLDCPAVHLRKEIGMLQKAIRRAKG